MEQQTVDTHKNNGNSTAGLMSSVNGFINSLLSQSNFEQSRDSVVEQAGLEFDGVHAEEFERLKLQVKTLDARHQRSSNILEKLEDKIENVKSKIRGVVLKGKGNKTPFSDWSLRDQFSGLLFSFSALVILGTGGANIYSNIMASGNLVFIENPFLAVLLSALFPAGTFSLKSFRDTLEEDRSRKRYTQFIFIGAITALLFWVFQFAIHFPGITSEINLDNLGESDGSGSVMVAAQLLAELLVSVSLYFAATDISVRYAPDPRVPNPEHIAIQDDLQNHRHEHDLLSKELGSMRGRLKQLESKREAFTNKVVSKYTSLRIQYDSSSLNSKLHSL